ncbi:HEXXH motif domain-containing protein [Thermomonospora cellulosilytica]|uniref:HEXXH motif-containing protein n=1 Tax=Thermomonospora cellulosilytica TaxID=1411118 RepID=A0A7W3MYR1_9ACTN|nr:HEXXH motif domain-containing protein [Thermomonospora cellulosilytica]MBA9004383.1 HEXXH motif-containing protein [Thermomonospora cellulosilytica]
MSSLPDEIVSLLAAGQGGAPAVGRLATGQANKRVVALAAVVSAAAESGHPEAAQAQRSLTLLKEIEQTHRAEARSVLLYPSVGIWSLRALRSLAGKVSPTEAVRPGAGLAALAAAAAVKAGHRCTVEVPVRDGAVVLPSLGRALVRGRSALVRSGPDGAVVTAGDTTVRIPDDPHKDGEGWESLRRLDAESSGIRFQVLLDDIDPDRWFGAEPLCERLGPEEVEHWRDMLGGAWRILTTRHPVTAEEIAACVTSLTPLHATRGLHTSGTPTHAFGTVGLSTPPDPTWLAATLAHEVQHTKLTALLDVLPLIRPDDDSRYYAPWREDPRPVHGLLHGVYAHLGLAAFWRRERHEESGERALHAHSEFARWRGATELAARTLAGSGRLTAAGQEFVARVRGTLRPWLTEPVPPAALDRARRDAERHLARWRRRHGEPPVIGTSPAEGRL